MPDKYDDYDWDELPKEAQEAAKKLGYNKKMWDKNKEPDTEEIDWDELSPEQQKAAEVLGFNQKKWDAS